MPRSTIYGYLNYSIAGTADAGMVYDEIMGAQAELTAATGRVPRFFCSGTAHYDDVAATICRALGLVPVNFTVNGDGGATYPAAAVAGELLAARPGSIIIAHANRPESGTGAGLGAALKGMAGQGSKFTAFRRSAALRSNRQSVAVSGESSGDRCRSPAAPYA